MPRTFAFVVDNFSSIGSRNIPVCMNLCLSISSISDPLCIVRFNSPTANDARIPRCAPFQIWMCRRVTRPLFPTQAWLLWFALIRAGMLYDRGYLWKWTTGTIGRRREPTSECNRTLKIRISCLNCTIDHASRVPQKTRSLHFQFAFCVHSGVFLFAQNRCRSWDSAWHQFTQCSSTPTHSRPSRDQIYRRWAPR